MAAAKVGNDATFNEPYSYAGITDLYFAAAFLPDAPESTTVVTLHNTIDLPGDLTNPNSQKKPAHVVGIAVGDISGQAIAAAPLCRPQVNGCARFDPCYRRATESRPVNRPSR